MKLVIAFILVTSFFYCAPLPQYKNSDHWDGENFMNLNGSKTKSLGSVIKWLWTRQVPKMSAEDAQRFLPVRPKFDLPLKEKELRVTYINHSTFILEYGRTRIITDPIFSERASPFSWAGPKRYRATPIRLEDVPKLDFIFVSHNHYDHMDLPSLEFLLERDELWMLVPKGNRKYFSMRNQKKILELDWGQTFKLASHHMEVMLTAAQHWSSRKLFDRNESLWAGAAIHFEGLRGKIFFAGDTGYDELLNDWILKNVSEIQLSFLPIGAYKPQWFMNTNHLSPYDAIKMSEAIRSKNNVAMHFGTFPLADDGIWEAVDDLNKLLETKKKNKQEDYHFKIPVQGEQWTMLLQ